MKLKNHYFILRHGESPINLKGLASSWPEKVYSPLTRKGIKQIEQVAEKLKNKRIDFIFSSDMLRTKQTAEIAAKGLGGLKIKFDKRLRDINVGTLNGRPIDEVGRFWAKEGEKISSLKYYKRRFIIAPPKGENYVDVENRLKSFLKDTEKKYQGKNILVVGHRRPFLFLEKIIFNWSREKFIKGIVQKKEMANGEIRKF